MIIQRENALGARDCRRLIALYERSLPLARETDHAGLPVLYWCRLHDVPGADRMLARLVVACLHAIAGCLAPAGALYPETVILAALGPGGCHPRHADNCRLDERGEWVANHTPQRAVSAIYYLNGDFEGGEIVFEGQRLTIKPRRGLLVAFPSDRHHVHEVVPVRSGRRYTVPIWFTRQESAALPDFAAAAPRRGGVLRRLGLA